jgi:hypothetical protein
MYSVLEVEIQSNQRFVHLGFVILKSNQGENIIKWLRSNAV